MQYEYLGQSLLPTADMSVRNAIAKLDPCKVDSGTFPESGQILYNIDGKNGKYSVLFIYPEKWDTEPFKPFEGRKSSQVFFEMRENEPPRFDVHLGHGYVKRYLPIWHIYIFFTFSPKEKEVLVSEELLEDMLEMLVREFRQNLK
jgi:hypothetical protein